NRPLTFVMYSRGAFYPSTLGPTFPDFRETYEGTHRGIPANTGTCGITRHLLDRRIHRQLSTTSHHSCCPEQAGQARGNGVSPTPARSSTGTGAGIYRIRR